MPWPTEGLIEIANKYLESEKIVEFDQELIGKIATFFGEVHSAVMGLSDKMFQKLKRKYYVTPTNYIELVNGYIDLLKQK
jgi:dynein heavy chain